MPFQVWVGLKYVGLYILTLLMAHTRTEKSPWTGLEICSDVVGVSETWICLSPEGYKHQWNASWELQNLTRTLCNDMGDNARVALYAPDPLAPYVSLPSSANGSTGYFKPTTTSGSITWDSIPLSGCTHIDVSLARNRIADDSHKTLLRQSLRLLPTQCQLHEFSPQLLGTEHLLHASRQPPVLRRLILLPRLI